MEYVLYISTAFFVTSVVLLGTIFIEALRPFAYTLGWLGFGFLMFGTALALLGTASLNENLYPLFRETSETK